MTPEKEKTLSAAEVTSALRLEQQRKHRRNRRAGIAVLVLLVVGVVGLVVANSGDAPPPPPGSAAWCTSLKAHTYREASLRWHATDVIVFIQPKASKARVQKIGAAILKDPDVQSVTYLAQLPSYQEFLNLAKNNLLLTQQTRADQVPTSYRIVARHTDAATIDRIVARYKGQSDVYRVAIPGGPLTATALDLVVAPWLDPNGPAFVQQGLQLPGSDLGIWADSLKEIQATAPAKWKILTDRVITRVRAVSNGRPLDPTDQIAQKDAKDLVAAARQACKLDHQPVGLPNA